MSGSGWLEGDAIEGSIPHRGANVLIDSVRIVRQGDSEHAESRLSLAPGDARGRDIFLRRSADCGHAVMEPVVAEHVALAALCVLRGRAGPDDLAFFSAISAFELSREMRAGEPLAAETVRLRDRGPFRRFRGVVHGEDGSTAAEAEIMVYTGATSATSERRGPAKLEAPPESGRSRRVDPAAFGWKRPEMVFIHERTYLSEDMERAALRYVYPHDHPFCAGHFPGNPVMMGVTQWMAALDAAAWLVFERAEAGLVAAGPARWRADVDIVREDGSAVAEVKGLVFSGAVSEEEAGPMRVESTRRVGFRDQVRPGEAIFMRASVEPVE